MCLSDTKISSEWRFLSLIELFYSLLHDHFNCDKLVYFSKIYIRLIMSKDSFFFLSPVYEKVRIRPSFSSSFLSAMQLNNAPKKEIFMALVNNLSHRHLILALCNSPRLHYKTLCCKQRVGPATMASSCQSLISSVHPLYQTTHVADNDTWIFCQKVRPSFSRKLIVMLHCNR